MIKTILELLKYTKGETKRIRIAQGKYYLPNSFKESIKQVKIESKWLRQ